MSKITVYQKPTCTTCRQVYAALKENGLYEAIGVENFVQNIHEALERAKTFFWIRVL